MAYLVLDLPPGMYQNGTLRQARGRWYDGNLVRFFEGTIRPIGGWRQKTYTGTLTNPFSTTNASKSVKVTQSNHGLRTGDQVYFANAATVGGLNMNMVNWTVATVVDANDYSFNHTSNANATVNGEGGTVNFTYAQKCAGKPRAIVPWKDNSAVTRAGVGTNTNLYVLARDGQLTDITPTGFTAGNADATSGGGYGNGPYGVSTYGTPRGNSSLIVDADMWSLDTWGQYIVGVMPADGKIYEWQLSGLAAQIANSPTAAALVVTDQRILMALGAGGNRRNVQWSDQENETTWTPAATNQAGSFNIQTPGRLMLARRYHGAVVILSDLDAWLATYTADVYVYSFQKIGDGCGAISRGCAAVIWQGVVWMGAAGFWLYNGVTQKLPCEVSDALFNNLNSQQQSKILCWHNAEYSEVTWYYPSASATENDSCVTWNYSENHWTMGVLARLAGADRGVMVHPLLAGSDGFIYEHEVGFSYVPNVGSAPLTPYLESDHSSSAPCRSCLARRRSPAMATW